MGLNCLHNLSMVVMASHKASSPLFSNLDGSTVFFFDDRTMVCIEVGDLLITPQSIT